MEKKYGWLKVSFIFLFGATFGAVIGMIFVPTGGCTYVVSLFLEAACDCNVLVVVVVVVVVVQSIIIMTTTLVLPCSGLALGATAGLVTLYGAELGG